MFSDDCFNLRLAASKVPLLTTISNVDSSKIRGMASRCQSFDEAARTM
jgi:hypothetical protein